MNESYILSLLEKNKRLDGRKLDDYRQPIIVEYGISKNAEGSAKVTIGETEVMVGAKLDAGEPYPDSPDEGTIIVTAELLPLSSPDFESGPPGRAATELARIVDRGIRESKAIDFKKLCIKSGEKVWLVFIDIYTINDSGNLIDAAALASIAALSQVKFPKLDENNKVVYGEFTTKKLPLTKTPITCTLTKINGHIITDATDKEEKAMNARLSIATENENIHALQKGGDKGLTIEEIEKMIDLAFSNAKELRKHLK